VFDDFVEDGREDLRGSFGSNERVFGDLDLDVDEHSGGREDPVAEVGGEMLLEGVVHEVCSDGVAGSDRSKIRLVAFLSTETTEESEDCGDGEPRDL